MQRKDRLERESVDYDWIRRYRFAVLSDRVSWARLKRRTEGGRLTWMRLGRLCGGAFQASFSSCFSHACSLRFSTVGVFPRNVWLESGPFQLH